MRGWRLGERAPDLLAVASYVALALVVTAGLWSSGGAQAMADNTRDHAQFLFFFEHAASAVTRGHNPLFTSLMGAPGGVNLMANTAFLGMAVPLIPVTLLAGPGVSYTLALTIGLAGTAVAWYVVLRRHVTRNRGVAFAAAALAGFSPGMVGHGNGHPNITAQFLLPLIISAVIRLADTDRPVRSGLLLGLLVAYQVFLNEELLMLTAVACVLMVVVYLAGRPAAVRARWRPFLTGAGTAVGVVALLTAYPLWFQFFGPRHYHGPFTWSAFYWTDLSNYPAYGGNSLAGWLGSASSRNSDPGETNAFLGLPLVIAAVVAAVVLWRVVAVRVAAVVAAVFVAFSLGRTVRLRDVDTGIPGPWRLVADLPLVDAVITPRLALVVAPAVAVILAAAADRLLTPDPRRGDENRPDETRTAETRTADQRRRALTWGLLGAVLIPLIPTPLPTTPATAVPAFYTGDAWRDYVGAGTIVPVPPDPYSEATLRALVGTGLRARFVDGYFLGPTSSTVAVARYGPPDRPTGLLLGQVAASGQLVEITDGTRAIARDDLRYWDADAVVLAPQPNEVVLRQTVELLLDRPGQFVDGVWVWDVRDLR